MPIPVQTQILDLVGPRLANMTLLNEYSEDVAKIEHWLNHTPRKCLGYKTPYETMIENLQSVSPHPSDAFEG